MWESRNARIILHARVKLGARSILQVSIMGLWTKWAESLAVVFGVRIQSSSNDNSARSSR